MSLKLTTLRGPETVALQTRQVDDGEFSIGRGFSNDWVLPDPHRHLSKRHCTLSRRGDSWEIADTSTNGTFLNRDETPLSQGGPRILQDGDRVRLGTYELEIRIAADPKPTPPAHEPERADERTRIFPRAVTLPPAPLPVESPVASGDPLDAFLRGAGMEQMRPEDPGAAMASLGAAFRALVEGVRRVLLARASIKSEFRIEQTMIRARGNNPLKFAPTDEAALAALLGLAGSQELAPAEAVRDALRDLQLHELASVAAMQAAVRALVAQFDPERLRAASEQGGITLVAAQRKARAWDAFEALHARTTRALDDDYESVFGRAFADAYERTLEEATSRR